MLFLLIMLLLQTAISAQNGLNPEGKAVQVEPGPHGNIDQQDAHIDWSYEIDLLGRELTKRHADLFFKTDSAHFFQYLKGVAQNADGLPPFNVAVRLQQVVVSLDDANTRINYHFLVEGDAILPLDCYWFEDGIFVLRTPSIYSDLLGKKITAINNFPLQQVTDSLSTLIVPDNQWMLKAEVPSMITWSQLLDHFGFCSEKGVVITYEEPTGGTGNTGLIIPPGESRVISANPGKLPLGWRKRNLFFWAEYLDNENIYYIQYNRCWSREAEEKYGSGTSALFMPSFRDFKRQVFRTIRKKRIDKLIFDMRFNSGGIASQGTEFIRKLGRAKFKGAGRVYVIIGRHTRSAALINVIDFKNYSDAHLVGEGTGGRPNHFGEVERFVLPESQLIINCSTKYYELLEDDPSSILPDLKASISFSDYMKGTDPALEVIRNHDPFSE